MMHKPHIVILMHYMELGGAEMSLLGLLHALDPNKVDVDLFIYSHQGPLMEYIPKWVNLLPEKTAYSVIEQPMTTAVKKGMYGVAAGRTIAKFAHRFNKPNSKVTDDGTAFQYVGKYVTPFLPKINPNTTYDLCISYLTPHDIGLKKVKAKKRLAWIHTDYSTVYMNPAVDTHIWGGFDHIASISPDVKTSFLKVYPSLKDKIIDIENILSSSYIKTKAEEENVASDMNGSINLLSIGRFCTAKNYDNVPDIARRMVELGVKDFKWYVIGFGGSEALIRSKIAEAGMEDHVIILGKKSNPYPYIKACDIYVQPSRYEGKSITVREAQILGKPVVVTAYPTASSQINDGVDGVIVPLDNQGCAEGISAFIQNKDLQNKIIENLAKGDLANVSEVEKIYKLLK